jgi:hypothetical protein
MNGTAVARTLLMPYGNGFAAKDVEPIAVRGSS